MAAGYTYEIRLKDAMSQGFAKAAQSSNSFANRVAANASKVRSTLSRIPTNLAQIKQGFASIKSRVKGAFNAAKVRAFNRRLRNTENRLRGVGGLVKRFGGLFAAYMGLTAVISLARNSLEKFDIQAKADAQLKNVLISTNNAAGRSYEQLKAQAQSLQKTTLFGDEATQEIQSMLLTFKNIKGELFDQTVPAVQDLATAMKVDGKSAAIQLGKALNDPATGLSMLGRSGITFTEAQKKLIKNFQQTNQLGKAQAIILKEINSQFGGSAVAAANSGEGAWQQFMNRIGDGMEKFGGFLSRIKGGIARFFNSFLDQAAPLISAWKSLKAAIAPLFEAIGEFLGALFGVDESTDAAGASVNFLAGTLEVLASVIKFVSGGIIAILKFLKPMAGVIKVLIGLFLAWKVVMIGWTVVMWAATGPIGAIVAGIVLLIAFVVKIIENYKKWGAAAALLLGPLGLLINLIMTIKKHWDGVISAFRNNGILAGLKAIGQAVVDFFVTPLKQAVNFVKWLAGSSDSGDHIIVDSNTPFIKQLVGQLGNLPITMEEKMALFTKKFEQRIKVSGAEITDEQKKRAIDEARRRLELWEKNKQTNKEKRIAEENAANGGGAGLEGAKSTTEGIATGGKRQMILNVQIDKVLETVNQHVSNSKESADDLVDQILDNLTRRLNGTFKTVAS